MPYSNKRILLAVPIAAIMSAALLNAQQPPPPTPAPIPAGGAPAGVEELARGPVHEAFGRPLVFDPQPGPIAPKEPPAAVEEVPPDEKPAGDNVAWIPGYWAWDDDQKQFIWVSGFWRDLPPGQSWVPGYWTHADQGAQWVSGYWAAAGTTDGAADVQYLAQPPETLEAGPPGAAPSDDQIWVPGLWVWQTNRYAWRPGFWATGYPDWVWTPARYQWSPLGYAYVPGFWDYPLWRRGLLFAPVAFNTGVAVQTFTPRLALNPAYLGYDLFVRPQTGSYFFGNYYANNYLQAGYYPWFSFHNTRFGYDPLFAHTDWVYARQNIDWEAHLRQVYYERRDQPAARPATLYRDYVRGTAGRGHAALIRPLAEMRTTRDLPFRMEAVNPSQVNQIQQHIRAERDFAAQRARLEVPRATQAGATGRAPLTVRMPAPPRLAAATTVGPAAAPRLPAQPTHPQPDLSRTASYPPAQPQTPQRAPSPPTPTQPPPKTTTTRPAEPQPSARPESRLPLPDQVLRPDYTRRPAQVPAPGPSPASPAPRPTQPAPRPAEPAPRPTQSAQPPVRPNAPAPPVVRPNPPPPAPRVIPPINGAPHPGHVTPPAMHPAAPPVKRPVP
jgi:hypothetical protein